MTEAELLKEVMTEALGLGLLVHHCPDTRKCQGQRGLPDLIILGPGGILLAELKDRDGDTSAWQDAWLYKAFEAGVRQALWRPANWESGLIKKRLQELAEPSGGITLPLPA